MKYLCLNTCHKNRIDKLNNQSAKLEGSPTFQGGDFFPQREGGSIDIGEIYSLTFEVRLCITFFKLFIYS